MKIVYQYKQSQSGIWGWVKVRKCQSFKQACEIAIALQEATGIPHCVNS